MKHDTVDERFQALQYFDVSRWVV